MNDLFDKMKLIKVLRFISNLKLMHNTSWSLLYGEWCVIWNLCFKTSGTLQKYLHYRVYKQILQVDKVVDCRYKNALLDQDLSFTWSTKPSNYDLKQENVGQIHNYVWIFKKAQEVKISLCPSKILIHEWLTYTKHASLPLIFCHHLN